MLSVHTTLLNHLTEWPTAPVCFVWMDQYESRKPGSSGAWKFRQKIRMSSASNGRADLLLLRQTISFPPSVFQSLPTLVFQALKYRSQFSAAPIPMLQDTSGLCHRVELANVDHKAAACGESFPLKAMAISLLTCGSGSSTSCVAIGRISFPACRANRMPVMRMFGSLSLIASSRYLLLSRASNHNACARWRGFKSFHNF
jgi:hypothetical protein